MAKMITMICDRCKAHYQPNYEETLYAISAIECGELDLCPACEKDLERWMDEGSDNNDK